MERMMNTALRERVAAAIYNDYVRELGEDREPFSQMPQDDQNYYGEQADAVLAALGLNDLDGAVERVRVAIEDLVNDEDIARAAIAALLATDAPLLAEPNKAQDPATDSTGGTDA